MGGVAARAAAVAPPQGKWGSGRGTDGIGGGGTTHGGVPRKQWDTTPAPQRGVSPAPPDPMYHVPPPRPCGRGVDEASLLKLLRGLPPPSETLAHWCQAALQALGAAPGMGGPMGGGGEAG